MCNIRFDIQLSQLDYTREGKDTLLRNARVYEQATSPGNFCGQWSMDCRGTLVRGNSNEAPEVPIVIDVCEGYNISELLKLFGEKGNRRLAWSSTWQDAPSIASTHLWAKGSAGRIQFDHIGMYVSEVRDMNQALILNYSEDRRVEQLRSLVVEENDAVSA